MESPHEVFNILHKIEWEMIDTVKWECPEEVWLLDYKPRPLQDAQYQSALFELHFLLILFRTELLQNPYLHILNKTSTHR